MEGFHLCVIKLIFNLNIRVCNRKKNKPCFLELNYHFKRKAIFIFSIPLKEVSSVDSFCLCYLDGQCLDDNSVLLYIVNSRWIWMHRLVKIKKPQNM